MRLRRRKKKIIDITPEEVVSELDDQQIEDKEYNEDEENLEGKEEISEAEKNETKDNNQPKQTKPKKKVQKLDSPKNKITNQTKSLFRKIVQNPNLNSQLMVIVFSLLSGNVQLERPLETMTSTIDKVRNISDVLNNTMQSVKVAADVPKQIRRLLK